MTPIAWITIIIALSLVLFIVELVVLPGVTVAGVAAFIGICCALAWTFSEYGMMWGFVALGSTIAIIGALTALFFRRRTWRKIALNTEISNTIDTPICEVCQLGAQATTLTRLSPMGNVEINGTVHQAKVLVGYIDPQTQVTVTGFDNHTLIVKKTETN